MKNLLFVLVGLLVAANLPAVTVFQNFDNDTWNYYVGSACGTAYSILPGWLMSQDRAKKGDLTTVGYTSTALGANAIAAGTAVTAIPQMWMQADFQYESGSTAFNSYFGLFYTGSDNAASSLNREYLGISVSGGTTMASSSTHVTSGGALATGSIASLTPVAGGLDVAGTYRVKMHFYQSGGNLVAEESLYLIDPIDGHLTQQFSTVTGTVAANNTSFLSGLDAFGIRNAFRNTSITASPMTHYWDNLYFSTDGPATGTFYPTWLGDIPEPATLIILGLGGLFLAKRK